jgi:DNA replicative helicase MCM subunit Mcm2 (Cdc46/Mcm family)
MQDDASYICDSCGEDIVVPIDISEGQSQEYTEDCPVCCHPNSIHVSIDEDGNVYVSAVGE